MAEKVNNSILKAEVERLYNTLPVSVEHVPFNWRPKITDSPQPSQN